MAILPRIKMSFSQLALVFDLWFMCSWNPTHVKTLLYWVLVTLLDGTELERMRNDQLGWLSARLWCSEQIFLCWHCWYLKNFQEIRKSWALEFDTGVLISTTCTTYLRAWTCITISISVLHWFNICILKAHDVSSMGVATVYHTGKWVNYVPS